MICYELLSIQTETLVHETCEFRQLQKDELYMKLTRITHNLFFCCERCDDIKIISIKITNFRNFFDNLHKKKLLCVIRDGQCLPIHCLFIRNPSLSLVNDEENLKKYINYLLNVECLAQIYI